MATAPFIELYVMPLKPVGDGDGLDDWGRDCYTGFVHRRSFISMDLDSPDAVPYFNWDAPVTNAEVRRALAQGDEEARLFWIARIMSEARYADIWKYVSLARDILPRWDRLPRRLGRRRPFWEFLIDRWRREGLL